MAHSFNFEWLHLREPFDHKARSDSLTTQFVHLWRYRDRLNLLDLGAGIGANLRYLVPKIDCNQRWTCIDQNDTYFEPMKDRCENWAHSLDWSFTERENDAFRLGTTTQRTIDVQLQAHNLEEEVEKLEINDYHACISSSFADQFTEEACDALVLKIAAANIPLLFTLIYNSQIIWKPSDPMDADVLDAYHDYLKQNSRLGDMAPIHLQNQLAEQKYLVQESESMWFLPASEERMINVLINKMKLAAMEVLDESQHHELDAWASRKQYASAGKKLSVQMGYTDLLAKPMNWGGR